MIDADICFYTVLVIGTNNTDFISQSIPLNIEFEMFLKKPAKILDKEQISALISQQLKTHQQGLWEDSISIKMSDETSFNNNPPINQISTEKHEYLVLYKELLELYGKKTLYSYIQKDTYPIPSADDREGYSPNNDMQYWLSGLSDYLKITEIAAKYEIKANTLFDFGCASARVLRHFACHSNIPELWGSDINARHIRWLYNFMPQNIRPVSNHSIPALPVRDNSMDIITGFSVFTHLDTFETCWLAELDRILADKGICYLTVQNEDTWKELCKQVDNPKNRLIQTMLKNDPETRNKLQLPLPDKRSVYRFTQSGSYRAQVFHSNNYIKQVWGRFFEIKEILPCHHNLQSVVILQKRQYQ